MSPVLLLVPALLMILAIVAIPRDWLTFLAGTRWRLIAFVALLLIGIWWLITPDFRRENAWIAFKILVLPYLFTGVAAFLMQASLSVLKISWLLLAGSAILLILVCLSLAYDASLGNLALLAAILTAIAASGSALVAAIWMARSLSPWRKVAALLMSIGFPFALFASIQLGSAHSPESMAQKNAKVIAQALSQYRAAKGEYPPNLEALVPEYVSDLREPRTMWGWLSIPTGDDYTLGYVFDVDKFGYGICKYSAKVPKWDCPSDYSTAPFTLAPTPAP
jgi:hypothetical protein